MWMYDRKLEYPIKIKNSNPALAKLVITQYGGLNSNRIHMKYSCQYKLQKAAFYTYMDIKTAPLKSVILQARKTIIFRWIPYN